MSKFDDESYLKHTQKDLRLAVNMSDIVDQPVPVTASANEVCCLHNFNWISGMEYFDKFPSDSELIDAADGKYRVSNSASKLSGSRSCQGNASYCVSWAAAHGLLH